MNPKLVYFLGFFLCAFTFSTFAFSPSEITDNDEFAPAIFSGLPDKFVWVDCGDPLPPVAPVTATELGVPIPVSYAQYKAGTKCGTVFYERHWTATSTTETITFKQTLRFRDETPPVLNIPNDTTIESGNPVPEPDIESYDACSWYDVTFTEKKTEINDCEYTLVRTWKAKDGCNNWIEKSQTINVVDTKAPVITVVNKDLKDLYKGEIVESYDCDAPQTSVSDVVVTDGCATVDVEAYDRLLTTHRCQQYGYYRKWRCGYIATDDAGNRSEFFFYMIQHDTTSPVLHNVPDDMDLECGDSIPPMDSSLVYARDNCSFRQVPQITEQYFVDPADSASQAVIRTWYFEDDCGNYAKATQVITLCNFDPALFNPDTTTTDTSALIVQEPSESVDSPFEVQVEDEEVNMFNVYPNPTPDAVKVDFRLDNKSHISIRVMDKIGRVVQSIQKTFEKGYNTEVIALNQLPGGLYMIVLDKNDSTQMKTILKSD